MTMLASGFLVAMGIRIMMVGEVEAESEVWWFIGPMLFLLVVGVVQGHRAAKAEFAKEQMPGDSQLSATEDRVSPGIFLTARVGGITS